MNKAIPFTILLFCSLHVIAQPTGLFFQNYSTVNGLCDNNINSIAQDSRGFIWIGTAEGLSRFDGISFKNYYGSRDSIKSFSNYRITNITEYKPHHLIFSSLGRPWCMNTLDNRFYQPPARFTKRYVSLITMIDDNKLLLSTGDTAFILDQHFNVVQAIVSPLHDPNFIAFPMNADTLM